MPPDLGIRALFAGRGNPKYPPDGLLTTPDGTPIRNAPTHLPIGDKETSQARKAADVRVRWFRLWEKDEHDAYESVIDKIVNNQYRLILRERRYVEEKQNFIWYVEYAEVYGMIPQGLLGPGGAGQRGS